jgi:hypothetical protein
MLITSQQLNSVRVKVLTFELAGLSDDSAADVGDPDEGGVVDFSHQGAAGEAASSHVHLDQVAAHLLGGELHPELPRALLRQPRRHRPLGRTCVQQFRPRLSKTNTKTMTCDVVQKIDWMEQ